MRILITGGHGYLGSALIPKIAPSCHRLDILDTRPATYEPSEKIRAFASTSELTFRDYEFIIHLSGDLPGILAQRHHHTGIILASSTAVYGKQNTNYPVDETFRLLPQNDFAGAQAAADLRVQAEKNGIVLRLAHVFGLAPHFRLDSPVHHLVQKAVERQSANLEQLLPWQALVHIDDVVDSLVFSVRHWDRARNQIFNVGNPGLQLSRNALVAEISKQLPLSVATSAANESARWGSSYAFSFNKLTRFGFTPRRPLRDTLPALVQHFEQSLHHPEGNRVQGITSKVRLAS